MIVAYLSLPFKKKETRLIMHHVLFFFVRLYYCVYLISEPCVRCIVYKYWINTISLSIVILFKTFLGGNLGSTWIGASDAGKQDWRWTFDLSKVTYSLFNPGQPDNGGNVEGCLELRSVFGYKWNDFPCSSTNSYVCESQQVIVIIHLSPISGLRSFKFAYCVHLCYRELGLIRNKYII